MAAIIKMDALPTESRQEPLEVNGTLTDIIARLLNSKPSRDDIGGGGEVRQSREFSPIMDKRSIKRSIQMQYAGETKT